MDAGVWPSMKPSHGRSGSRMPRSSLRDWALGCRWWSQDSWYVRLGEANKIAEMLGEACMYLVHTP